MWLVLALNVMWVAWSVLLIWYAAMRNVRGMAAATLAAFMLVVGLLAIMSYGANGFDAGIVLVGLVFLAIRGCNRLVGSIACALIICGASNWFKWRRNRAEGII